MGVLSYKELNFDVITSKVVYVIGRWIIVDQEKNEKNSGYFTLYLKKWIKNGQL